MQEEHYYSFYIFLQNGIIISIMTVLYIRIIWVHKYRVYLAYNFKYIY